ncbi:MAG: hypothetical protein AVDCRST_MAG47-116 [uncultured Nocardioidaceae bacterium]|uniref:Thioesterase family protein n=1 Tax=uncultured Nocardioidaceae bacterium TaxID=253824 RepID=A0A6J4MIF1_9ACTN|nr:MAG: hypothetical protein AVDCRST_MAG47-116 [uncultured Nocardioidaceae bacterium]
MDTMQVPARFNGPASSGNGGWTSGALAEISGLPQPVTVQLRRPPPLDRPLHVVRDGDAVELRDGEDVVAVAMPGTDLSWEPPAPVDLPTAREAERSYPGHRSHPFPRCFSCGPDRDDGLRIFPGRVDGNRVAATWTPAEDTVDTPAVWAALDCVSAWSSDLEERPLVLAQMTARIGSPPEAGTPYAVVGTTVRTEGRKTWTASALHDRDGELVAQAQHLWIAIDPAVVKQLQDG